MSNDLPWSQVIESVLREGVRDLAHIFHYPHRKFSRTPEPVDRYHARLEAKHKASHYADEAWLSQLIDGVLIEGFGDCRNAIGRMPHPRLAAGFSNLIEELLSDNKLLFPFPPINHAMLTNDAYAVPHRRKLMDLEPYLEHEERVFDTFANITCAMVTGISSRFLPKSALVTQAQYMEEDAESPSAFDITLLDVLPNPKGCVQAIVATFLVNAEFDSDPPASLAFAETRRQIAANLFSASRLTPEQAQSNPARLVLPEASDLAPHELVRAYLRDTPFIDFFAQRVPFSLTEFKKHHWSIYARTGHGKSQLLQTIILQHLKEDNPPGMIVIDSESDLREGRGFLGKLERLDIFAGPLRDRLVVVEPRESPALNPFKMPQLEEEDENDVLDLYAYIFSAKGAELTNRMDTHFSFMMRLLFKHPNATLEDMFNLCREGTKKISLDASAYRDTIRKLDPIAQNFFEDSFFKGDPHGTKEQLASRLRSLLSTQMLARMLTATDNKLDLYRFMEERKVVLVSTAGLGKEGPLFGRFILSLAVKAAYQRQIDNNNPCLLFIDEASTMLDTNIDTILNKTRKYGLFVRFATQLYAQIPDKIRAAANANTTVKLTGGLTASDANFFANDMHTTSQFLASTEFSDREFTEFACYVQHHTPTAIKLKIPLGQLERAPTMDSLTYQAMRQATRGMLRATPSRTVEESIQEVPERPTVPQDAPDTVPFGPKPD